ncbi:aminotransferase class III-fold pyridoxal phosphate-dependent enzyme [Xanthobacter sediminis]|uniref:aminotransferase class III-fold pyridoxal phosphate-dependent enzyme n=1 Tax=Xanthobacter sediminis TaxID=3119926 RepID=UPI00372985B8
MPDPILAPVQASQPEPPVQEDAAAPAHILDFTGSFDLARDEEAETAPQEGRDAAELIERLLPISFADRGYLLPDAAAAGRHALQAILGFQQAVGRPKRTRLLYCAGPHHAPLPEGLAGDPHIDILTTDDAAEVEAAITPKTAGILIAPVRTVPTLELPPRDLLAVLREAADGYGIVFAFDETASGLGRTGMSWAYEWSGVTPDLMIMGSGLAGAEPLAAVLATAKVARGAPAPAAVNPAAVEIAHQRLDQMLAPDFEATVQRRSWALEDRLTHLSYLHRPVYTAVVGLGLMQGLVCTGEAAPLAARAAAHGLLTRPLGNVLGLFPALTVSEAELDAAADILARIAGEAD